MTTVKIIGAGQLGSRHLQALKNVAFPLSIEIIDPSPSSLETAKERYEAFPSSGPEHRVRFLSSCQASSTDKTELAIVATNSDVRKTVVEELLNTSHVRYLILEKLLFQQPEAYEHIGKILLEQGTQAWVNCPMRVMPTYQRIQNLQGKTSVSYRVSGGKFGLVTNAIHYLDHVAQLSGCKTFRVDTSDLVRTPFESKRKGFWELRGTLRAIFSDGSTCTFTTTILLPPSSSRFLAPTIVGSSVSRNKNFGQAMPKKIGCGEKKLQLFLTKARRPQKLSTRF